MLLTKISIYYLDCNGITLIDDTVQEIATTCKPLRMKKIQVWDLKSWKNNEKKGKWFDITDSVKKYFQVTTSNKVVSHNLFLIVKNIWKETF